MSPKPYSNYEGPYINTTHDSSSKTKKGPGGGLPRLHPWSRADRIGGLPQGAGDLLKAGP